jgi:GAF domain
VHTHQQWDELLRAASHPAGYPGLDVLLQQAVQLGSQIAPDAVSCSITEISGGDQYHTPVYSDQLALDLDKAQYEAGNGPCMAAAREQERQYFDAATDSDRYPGFTEAARERGVRSSISLPLPSSRRSAALNVYASSRYAFDAERPRAVADLLARCVSVLMTPSDVHGVPTEASVPEDSLHDAQARARLIGRAEAVLAAQRSVSRQDALTVLIRRSRAEVRSIFEVAREVAATAEGEPAL